MASTHVADGSSIGTDPITCWCGEGWRGGCITINTGRTGRISTFRMMVFRPFPPILSGGQGGTQRNPCVCFGSELGRRDEDGPGPGFGFGFGEYSLVEASALNL